MTDLDALAGQARASISALRDEARRLGQMPFRERDDHVMRLHRALDALLATARRERRMREALIEAREYIDAPCDPIAIQQMSRIDAALAEEGQDDAR